MRHKQDYRFSQVPAANIPRSVFKRNHQYKTTFNAGQLIPIYVDEVLPGDTFRIKLSLFCRLAVPIVAVMDNIYLDIHFFYVPTRLLWDNWAKFCGEQANPGDSTSYVTPKVTPTMTAGSLADYMGLPLSTSQTCQVVAFPFRAYNLIYNEWYRDENLVTAAAENTGDGPDGDQYPIRKRGKRHDYFTSCLPWPQKGPGVMLPLGTSATVKTATSDLITGARSPMLFRKTADGAAPSTTNKYLRVDSSRQLDNATGASVSWSSPETVYPTNLYADLSSATAATINSLRQAFQVQHLLERDARGGTRYVEILKAHFGVVSPDFRLQRPEFLGGGTAPVIINPVYQVSATVSGQTPQGNVAAYGIAARHGIGFVKSFVEHGWILGIASARSDMTYQQGINRMWSRSTRYDYYWPALAHIGEQAVLNKEIYFQNNATYDDAVFGYQERWAEYKYKPSLVTGLFRSTATGSLEFWHLAQKYTALPTLNQTFIEENVPLARVKAVAEAPDFLFDSYFDCECARPMPLYSVPGLIDHF